MAAPPTPQEGASQTRPPLFNGKYYGGWKNRMMDHLLGENPDLWGVVNDGPTIPMKNEIDGTTKVPKDRKEWNAADKLAIQNNAKAKKILICGIGPDEYNRISSCEDAKAIWETLHTAHEGTTQVKKSKIDNLNRQYELFRMTEGETIQEMHTRFTAIINEIYSLGEIISNGKAVRKLLSVLPESWESKVEAITEAQKKRNSSEKEKEIKNDKYIPTNRRMTNQEADLSTRRSFTAMGDLSEEEFEDGGFENQSLLAIEQSNKYDFLALIAETDSEDDEEDDKQSKVKLEIRLILENMMMRHSHEGLEYEELEKNQSKHGLIETS
ncbi:uncharacterized protein LOC107019377 [Solanum pennellii]|uniref:Uncharacterized protein LOC107019377 n=1 Tax=Solanum pennellii TaxID=28526 RepID=A0ABM1GSR2_SOLPN|nr:uncharacterized protein LOC107019377 [Solanum pennellii]